MVMLGQALVNRSTTLSEPRVTFNVREKLLIVSPEELKARAEVESKLLESLQTNIKNQRRHWETTSNKILTNWRVIMGALKEDECRQALETHFAIFRRSVELKDGFIAFLDTQICEASDRQKLSLRAHLAHLDRFLALQNTKLSSLFEDFSKTVSIVSEEFNTEFEQINTAFAKQKSIIEGMMNHIKEEDKRKAQIQREVFHQLKEEIKDKATEEKETMNSDMTSRKMALKTALDSLFQKFTNDTKEQFNNYTKLMEENTSKSHDIDKSLKRLHRTKDKIKLMSVKIFQMEREFEQRNRQIKSENDEIARNFLELKKRMFAFREKEKARLTKIVIATKSATDYLTSLSELGSRILRNCELCAKLEFEEEKVAPFPLENEEEVVSEDVADFATCAKYEALRNYFRRYNKVNLDTLSLQKKKQELMARNKELKDKLLKYLDGVSISPDCLSSPANVLLVSNSLSLTRDSAADEFVTIDATFEARKMQLQNYVYNPAR